MKLSHFIKFSIILVLFYSMQFPIRISSEEIIVFPAQIIEQGSIDSGFGNDIYIKNQPFFNMLNGELWSEDQSFDTTIYDGITRTNLGSTSPLTPIPLNAANGYYQFSNLTNDPLSLQFNYQYYDLFNYKSPDDSETINTLLEEGNLYGFKITLSHGSAYSMDLFIDGISNNFVNLVVYVIDPNGEIFNVDEKINRNVKKQIPIYPLLDGIHTIFLSPVGENIYLQTFEFVESEEIISVEQGFGESIQDTEGSNIFYQIAGISGASKIYELGSIVKNNTIIIETSLYTPIVGTNYLGEVEIKEYSTNPLGNNVNNVVGQLLPSHFDEELIMSVTINPPDDDDPSVKKIKEDLGLEEGYDIEYSFWANTYELSDLPIGRSFYSPVQPYSSNFNYYVLSINQPHVISFNATANSNANFISNDGGNQITINSNTHNINENGQNSLQIIPAGDYTVEVRRGIGMEFNLY
ncbi:MAG: hypothetical protein OEY49_17795, partial [Candidatus Heimdallarchaeota archaeon]|nr:hypothetical protein [Candidatus Heimdallarchaeota archaeon]